MSTVSSTTKEMRSRIQKEGGFQERPKLMHLSSPLFEIEESNVPGRPPPWPSWNAFVLARRSRCVLFTLTSSIDVASISFFTMFFLLFSLSICFLFYARLTSSSKFAYLLCASDFCLKLMMTLLLFFFLYPSCYVLHRSIRTPRTPLSLNYGRFVRPQQGCRLFRRSLAPRTWNPADGGAAPPVR